jgi:hypothetical protein
MICILQPVWHGVCHTNSKNHRRHAGFENLDGNQEMNMFDGKNNRLLDSFAFRVALTAAIFAAWSGAGYILLSLA